MNTSAGLARMAGAGAALAGVICVGMLLGPRPGNAQNGSNGMDEAAMIAVGFAITPVPLNANGKDHDLLGLGSFLVNAVGDCNGCHTSDPNGSEFTASNNPYLLMPPKGTFTGSLTGGPIKVNPNTYLAGGQFFGQVGTTAGFIISRNLTPDYRGLPEGGHSLSDFLNIMQTGVDLDAIHPTCPSMGTDGCATPPTNGAVLQVMPWPIFRNMTTRQLTAIWTYLSAIPCINNTGAGLFIPNGYPVSELSNTCSK